MTKDQLREAVGAFLEHCRTENKQLAWASEVIVQMTFLSPPEEQWEMVLEAIRQAQSDDDLATIAAGPIEGLLGRFGEWAIDKVEKQASIDPKFHRAMTGVWKNTMPDHVWKRVQTLQRSVSDPLASHREDQ